MRHRLLVVIGTATLLSACASTGAIPQPFPQPDAARGPETEPSNVGTIRVEDGDAISGTALSLTGVPYRNGGSDPSGFDCSGFVQYVFARHGLRVPREVRDQFKTGRPVNGYEVQPGDLLFFTTIRSGASHVAIAIGGDQFVHAPSSRGNVRVESLTSSYWRSRYLTARRFVG